MTEEHLSTCFCSDADESNWSSKEQDLSINTLDTVGRWTTPMVRLLIKQYIDNKNNTNLFGKRLWTNVAVSMQEKGYPVNPHQCSEKWRNLKKTYIKIRDTVGKNASRRNKWEFYNEMEEALGEQSNSLSASPIDNCNVNEEITDNNSIERPVEVVTSQTISNIPLELCKFEVYSNDDSSTQPSSPLAHSPALHEERSDEKINYSNSTQEISTKRKSPPLEWYDKYLEELRAARYDRNKRHQDKQLFRQQLLDLCKQMLITSSSNSKEMSS
ncbi:unnamed protein product [Nezara viridula]|uniref:Myb/SANT-like DNA-binding domain-containing protein n=1 Tax=Nezara viridula TaxID=85310 RepID=A0A9P0MXH6_NEZVI|nr:unnamed protein product [Nezara viridula]